jgi:hypothetical protein
MHEIYLTEIPKPIDSDRLLILRRLLGFIQDPTINAIGSAVSREEAWEHVERVAIKGWSHLGSVPYQEDVDAIYAELEGTDFVIATEQPQDRPLSEASDEDADDLDISYEESVARIALVTLRRNQGDLYETLNEIAMLAAASGETPDAPSLFSDAGTLICATFRIEDQVNLISAMAKAANVEFLA